MKPANFQLTPSQLSQFVTHGFVVLNSGLPPSFHEEVYHQLNKQADGANFGNNLIPQFPILHELLEDSVIDGALSSLLGEDYLLQPHRHGHTSTPSRYSAGWHKDSYWGYQKIRRQRPWMCMIMYYPQAGTATNGPTQVIPGSQYFHHNPLPEHDPSSPYEPFPAEIPAGSFLLLDYHLWHSGSPHIENKPRFMLKFQFSRQSRPAKSSVLPPLELPEHHPYYALDLLWTSSWNWLHGHPVKPLIANPTGEISTAGASKKVTADNIATVLDGIHELAALADDTEAIARALSPLLDHRHEAVAFEAAYALATKPTFGVPVLAAQMDAGDENTIRCAAHGMTAAGDAAVPHLNRLLDSAGAATRAYALFALGEIGVSADGDAARSIIRHVEHDDVVVRRHAVEALGMLPDCSEATIGALVLGMQDEDEQVRYMAATSLSRLASSPHSAAAIPALSAGLKDENRYVRAYSIEALVRMPNQRASQIATKYLTYSRWCPLTTAESPFH